MTSGQTRLRILEIGHGRWGALYASELADRGVLAGVVTASRASADIAARRWGTHGYVQLEQAIAQGTFDGAVVMSPTRLHANHVRSLIDAGLPCLVAKPAAITTQDARALHAYAEAAQVSVLVGHDAVFTPLIAHVLTAIDRPGGRDATGIQIQRRGDPETAGMPSSTEYFLAWVYEAVMHDMSVCNRFAGRVPPDEVKVSELCPDPTRPKLRVHATYPTLTATIDLHHEPGAPFSQRFTVSTGDGQWVGEALARSSSLLHRPPGGVAQAVAVADDGGQHARLVERFLTLVRDRSTKPTETCADAAHAIAAADVVVEAVCREVEFSSKKRVWARLGERPKDAQVPT